MCLPIQSEYTYLDRWYIEKETVRTSVTLAKGAVTPIVTINKSAWIQLSSTSEFRRMHHAGYCGGYVYNKDVEYMFFNWKRTSKEASNSFRMVRFSNTMQESIVRVCLQSSLDAVEREGGDGGQYAGRAC